jgi:hypothetical protein
LVFSFIETRLFTRLVQKYLTEDEYHELQKFLMERPDSGAVIRGTGGVRRCAGLRPLAVSAATIA